MLNAADREFLRHMIMHHEEALTLARAELVTGRDSRVLTLARAILKTQAEEIARMRGWLASR